MNTVPLLQVEGIHTYYGASHILHGVDLRVAPGESLSLMGRNGMGKTTTIRSVFGLTPAALEAIESTLGRGEQVMVFLNRRGYAPVLMCQSCGWFGNCERCDAHMTWHRQARLLCCHHCGSQRRVP